MSPRSVVAASVALLLLATCPVAAHDTGIFAHVEDGEIHGTVTADGEPLAGAEITAHSPTGELLGEAASDHSGQFRLTVHRRCDWKIVATEGGHQATYTVPMAELPTELPADLPDTQAAHDHPHDEPHTHAPAPSDLDDLTRQVVALRGDIDKLRNELRWQDLVGGVGYILGLMGLAFYFLGTRRRERFPPKSDD
jgi:nickel transport protein